MKAQKDYYEYRGVTIWRGVGGRFTGVALRYTARSLKGDPLTADTLAGIKELIRESEHAR